MNRLDELKLCNDYRKVEKKAKGGMKMKDIANKVGVSNSDVIIVHAGTCEIKNKTPEELRDEIVTALPDPDCRTGRGICDHALTIFVHYLPLHGIHDNA